MEICRKPRDGPIFTDTQFCRMKYRKYLRDNKRLETVQYTNDSHALYFWKTILNSGSVSVISLSTKIHVFKLMVESIPVLSRVNFPNIFQELIYVTVLNRLNCEFRLSRSDYCAMPGGHAYTIDTELVSHVTRDNRIETWKGFRHWWFVRRAFIVLLPCVVCSIYLRNYFNLWWDVYSYTFRMGFDTVMLYPCLSYTYRSATKLNYSGLQMV